MLIIRNVQFQHQSCNVDDSKAMRASNPRQRNASIAETTVRQPLFGRSVSMADLAHELNSLLDGSIRSLALAEQSLETGSAASGTELTAVHERLRLAKAGLRSMAELLDRALQHPSTDLEVFSKHHTLAEAVAQATESIWPLAQSLHVEFSAQIDEASAALPARSLGPVILNGLRNALRAAADADSPQRRVSLVANLNALGELSVSIDDSGSGVSPTFEFGRSEESNGHGIGLELSRRIVADLDGRIELLNSAKGAGATLRITIPRERLVKP